MSLDNKKEDPKVKVAIVGAGNWGLQHTRVFSARPDVEVVALVGRTLEKTRERASQFGLPYYLSIKEMLKQARPDLVSICLPNQEHFEPTLEVIEAGLPLLVEKPLVFELEQADVLLEEASQKNLFFAINFNHRYAVPVQMAKQAVETGRVGEISFATWRFGGEGSSDHPHANLIETQCHAFDQLEYLCGPIDSIVAQMTDKTGQGYRTLVLALHFKSGAVGSLVGSYDSSYAYPATHLVEVNGDKGRIVIEDTVRRFSFQAKGNESAEVWQAGYFNDRDREFHRTFDKYLDVMLEAFKKGAAPPVPAEAGRRALKLAYAAIESFNMGKHVKV